MRQARVRAEGVGCYHVVSRIVDRNFRLDDGEKEIFRGMLRRAEAFCGVRVLTYALMSNHFHLLVEVPERGEVDEAELVRRMTILYGRAHTVNVQKQWAEWRTTGAAYLVMEQQDRLRARMCDISAFVKTLKQRYSMSYNGRHGRKGTLWEDRFKSVMVENAEGARAAVAAYIDLNPVRAKIVDDPKDYRWSGYGEERREAYTERVVRPGIGAAEVEMVLEAGGRLTLQQALRCRVRYFTDGLAVGGKAFVDGVFESNRRCLGPQRRDGARKMRHADWGGLRVARALRVAPVTAPLSG